MILCLLSSTIVGQSIVPSPNDGSSKLTRAEVLLYTGASTAIEFAVFTEVGFADPADLVAIRLPWWITATMLTQHIPL